MKISKLTWIFSLLMIVMLTGCGGGGGSESNGTLSLSVTNTTVDAGNPLQVEARFATALSTNPLNGLKVKISSPDHPELVNPITIITDLSGIARGTVTTNNTITKQVKLSLVAKLDDLTSPPVTVTLNPTAIDLSLGTLALTIPETTVNAGASFAASAKLTVPNVADLSGQVITFKSDNPAVGNVSGVTDVSGNVSVLMPSLSTVTTATTANIKAYVASLSSPPVAVTVNPATLTLTPPADATFTVPAASAGGTVRWVVSGAQVKVTSDTAGANPIQNQPVIVSVQTIVNQNQGDQVMFWPDPLTQVIAPPGTITLTTDSKGIVILPVSIDLVAASPGNQHVITVIWKITSTTGGGNLVGYGSSMYTIVTSAS